MSPFGYTKVTFHTPVATYLGQARPVMAIGQKPAMLGICRAHWCFNDGPFLEDAMKRAMFWAAATLFGVALLGGTTGTRADVLKLKAELKGSNEVPPNTSTASGNAEATFDTDSKTLSYTVTFSGLTGPAIGAHFHGPSEAGKNAGIVLPFKTVQSPIQGSAVLTDSQATDLLAGKWYANIHTAANPGGELRGQMVK
jgi:CHRD domain